MIPFRDENPSRTVPIVTRGLVALNVAFFGFELWLGQDLGGFIQNAAIVPSLVAGRDLAVQPADFVRSLAPDLLFRFVVSMFLHGGLMHLAGNMLYLWIFGDNIEDRFGHGWFLAFYLLCGGVATWAHILSAPSSNLPSIGASGAIAGVLGAYLMFFPRAQVVTLLPLGFFSRIVKIPAVWFLGFWFLTQFLSGVLEPGAASVGGGGVAWWAHIGGFACGLLIAALAGPAKADSWNR
jgi:membrane associated rhomboid family serine protease